MFVTQPILFFIVSYLFWIFLSSLFLPYLVHLYPSTLILYARWAATTHLQRSGSQRRPVGLADGEPESPLFDVAAQRFLTHSLHYEDQSEAANAYVTRRARQMAVLLHLSDAVRKPRLVA